MGGFSGGSGVKKNLPANAGYADSIPGLGRSLGERNATHSKFLPGTSHGGLQSMGSQKSQT